MGAEPGPQGPARLFGCAALGGRLNPSADSGAGRDRGRGGAMVLCPVIGKLLQKHVVLASASPRRQEILSNAGLRFEVVPSRFKEKLPKASFPTPHAYAVETAKQKALEVASRMYQKDLRAPDIVIGADTIVAVEGLILEKPVDKQDAYRMLSRWVAVGRPPSWETACILGWAEAPSPLVGVGWGVGAAPTSPVPAGAPPGPDRWRWPGPLNVPPPRGAARASIRPQASTPGHSLSLSCQPPPEHSPQEPGHPSSRPGGAGAVPLCACVGHSHHPPSSGPLPGSATPGQPPPGEGATASGSLCSRRVSQLDLASCDRAPGDASDPALPTGPSWSQRRLSSETVWPGRGRGRGRGTGSWAQLSGRCCSGSCQWPEARAHGCVLQAEREGAQRLHRSGHRPLLQPRRPAGHARVGFP